MSFPRQKARFLVDLLNSSASITSLKNTGVKSLLGTSIPTAAFPGIGASILTPEEAKFRAISSDRFTILLTLTPTLG
ncbi:hypothetical protein SDC9_119332 [bioreactor metagenome]|uniref:Uncharacterized protein n=1 Tax=bioreactor metagenome TaxID=1076179 RepID=A0A645C401_9ZZZZ